MYRDEDQRNFARKRRNEMTDAEKRLWRLLRAKQLTGHKFRRQAAIGPYIVDFACFSHKLVIELDGPQHIERQNAEHDARRSKWLIGRRFRVIRFRNQQLDENVQAVVDAIGARSPRSNVAVPNHPALTLPVKGRGPNNEFSLAVKS
jgi:very-short-patch-repair endonuclease